MRIRPSLFLLVIVYVFFGWYWESGDLTASQLAWQAHHPHMPLQFWTFVLVLNLLLIGFWTAPVRIIEAWVLPWCRNTLISFPLLILLAVVGVLTLTYVDILSKTVMASMALAIARLELQEQNLGYWPLFGNLAGACLLGVLLGVGSHYLYGRII
jgi:hypothetical protein